MTETERQLSQSAQRKAKAFRSNQASDSAATNSAASNGAASNGAASISGDRPVGGTPPGKRGNTATGSGANQEVDDDASKAWRNVEMLRAQHQVLVQEVEQSNLEGDADSLHEISRLQAACWQLHNDKQRGPEAAKERAIAGLELPALELAAIAVAVDFTSSSGLSQKILGCFDCEVRSLCNG